MKTNRLTLSILLASALIICPFAYSSIVANSNQNAPAAQSPQNKPENKPAAAPAAMMLAANSTMNAAEQKQIEGVIHNYLVKNPEVIVESLQNLQQKQMEQARKTIEKTQALAPKFIDALFHVSTDPMIGNPSGKITVVEFFDYQCPHCVEMTPVLEGLALSNPDLRIVFKEFPIRGALSDTASRAALAAKIQGKYFEFHKALMDLKQQPLTEDAIYKAAQQVGLNVDKLKADMKSDAVNKEIKANYKLAQDLQLIGTPAFFVAKSSIVNTAPATAIAFIPGQVNKDQLQETIKKISQ